MTALSSIVAIVLLGVPTVLANLGLRRRWARVIALVWIGVFAGLVALEGLLIFGCSRPPPRRFREIRARRHSSPGKRLGQCWPRSWSWCC
ncbi:MAG: hypothetical protein M3075_10545 [Candidatus Dormibacteraeota bacterium]|nr:hypothetical protein [Candidatus Dormibacteraeota bacterium]